MTPLAWWVLLLAGPLAATTTRSSAVPAQWRPVDDACVALCHPAGAKRRSGLVDARQSDEGVWWPRGLFRLCLTPRPGHVLLEPSELCRRVRTGVRERRGCVCEDPPTTSETRDVLGEDAAWLEELVRLYSAAVGARSEPIESPRTGDRREQDPSSTTRRRILDAFQGATGEVDDNLEELVPARFAAGMMSPLEVNQASSTLGTEVLETTLADVDWDKWCMTQCSTGHGGSACSCDIIP